MKKNNYFSSTFSISWIFCVAFLFVQCKQNNQKISDKPIYEIETSATYDSAMVVAAHPLATDIGKEIMKQGGNAIDAVIATQFALAVVCPRAGNIGGGGFMIIRMNDGESAALDYREKAPMSAHPDMYLDSLGKVIKDISRKGHLSIGVPGTVAGLFDAHSKYGKIKDFKDLVTPSIKLAKEGFKITSSEADRLNKFKADFQEYNTQPTVFIKNAEWKKGDLFIQKDLAATLQRIADNGKSGFYKGQTANLLIEEMKRGNGLITKEDLESYEAVWREPMIGEYRDYKIISMPPPSSGGICLLQILEGIEDYPIKEMGYNSPEAIHLITESERRAYADRAKHIGDTDFYPVPLDTLRNPDYIRSRMSNFDPAAATQSDSILAGNIYIAPESFETTHTSVVDPNGNSASVTTTLNLNYGSKVVVGGAGFFLNDEMDDFSAKPGVPNFFGLVGAEANKIEAGKRMLSSMTPTIIEKNNKLFMVIGSPGGSTIITSVAQVFLNVAEFDMNIADAVQAKRFHHQWLPNTIMTEPNTLSEKDSLILVEKGHIIDPKARLGLVKAIHLLENGKLSGSGDARNADDDVSGF